MQFGFAPVQSEPTFQAMIDDHDAAGPNRNVRGPNIVRRLPRGSWPAYMHRIEDA